jgi:hypothetical protein
MKRINKSLSTEYPTVKLFLEDLIAIESILKESAENFEIATDDYTFTSVDELKNKYKNEKLSSIKISTRTPYINIVLNKTWVRLYCGSEEISTTGIYYKLDKILSAKVRKPRFLYSYYIIWIGNILLFASIPSYFLPKKINPQILLIGGVLSLIWFIWILWFSYIRLFRSSDISLIKKVDLRNFFSRNKDQIIVGLINGIIGAVIGIIGTIFAYQFKLLR